MRRRRAQQQREAVRRAVGHQRGELGGLGSTVTKLHADERLSSRAHAAAPLVARAQQRAQRARGGRLGARRRHIGAVGAAGGLRAGLGQQSSPQRALRRRRGARRRAYAAECERERRAVRGKQPGHHARAHGLVQPRVERVERGVARPAGGYSVEYAAKEVKEIRERVVVERADGGERAQREVDRRRLPRERRVCGGGRRRLGERRVGVGRLRAELGSLSLDGLERAHDGLVLEEAALARGELEE